MPLQQHLEDAILRDLITDERVPDEPTFRFRHILIRDVAYATLPKARRAELHRGVADWLRAWFGDRIDEYVEIEAYHLEQAVRLRHELEGSFDPAERDRAVASLGASAKRAQARDDFRAARTFADRALALEPPPGDARLELRVLLADALWRLSEYRLAGEVAIEVEQEARAAGRKDIEGQAILIKAGDIWLRLESSDAEVALAEVERAITLLTEANDKHDLVAALELRGWGGWWHGDLDAARSAWTEMRLVAHELGWSSREAEAMARLAGVAGHRGEWDERVKLVEEARELAAQGPSRLARARVSRVYGIGLLNDGKDEEATEQLTAAGAVLEEFGDREEASACYQFLGDLARRKDQLDEAMSHYDHALDLVREHIGYLPEVQRRVAQLLLMKGDVAAAAEYAEEAARLTGKDDLATVASTGMVIGRVREAQGSYEEAEKLLREAIEVITRTDFNPWEEELAMAEFLLRRGRTAEGAEWLARAHGSVERQGPTSPLIELVERRGREAMAAAAQAGTSGPPNSAG